MSDPLSVNIQTTSLHVRFNDPRVRQKATMKLQEMQREIKHIETAVRTIQTAIQTNTQFPNQGVARAKQQLRDWSLSFLESVAYVETLLGGDLSSFRMELLAARAARLGEERGRKDQ